MKKHFTFLSAMMLVWAMTLNAGIWTVNNNTGSPGQFTDLQTAIDNASPGDTILVSGSNDSYGTISIKKPLTIIGTGWKSDSEFGMVSNISSMSFDTIGNPISSPSGSNIIGLYINSITFNDRGISDITMKRNRLGNTILYSDGVDSNYFFSQNWFYSFLYLNNNSNVLIGNNIFSHPWNGHIVESDEPSVLIFNNIFYTGANDISHAALFNNIFLACPTGFTYCSFNNNLTFYHSATCTDLPFGSNTGDGNINNIDPEFVNGDLTSYDPDGNYRLSVTSPGINAGTDGNDIGIYGGTEPFVDGGIPNIPQILFMHVLNPVVPKNTDLNIHVKARVQD